MFRKTLVLLLVVLLSISFVFAKQHGDVKAKKESKAEEVVVENNNSEVDVEQNEEDLDEIEDEVEEVEDLEEHDEIEDEQDILDEEEDFSEDEEYFEDEESFDEEDEFYDEDLSEEVDEEEGWEDIQEEEVVVEEKNNKKSKNQNFDLAGILQNTRTASNYETQAPPDPSLSRTPSFIPPTQSFTPVPFPTQSNTPRGGSISNSPQPPAPASASFTPGFTQTNSPAGVTQSNTPGSGVSQTNSPAGVSFSNTPAAPSSTRTPRPVPSRTSSRTFKKRKPVVSDCSVVDNNDCNNTKNCYWDINNQKCVPKPKSQGILP